MTYLKSILLLSMLGLLSPANTEDHAAKGDINVAIENINTEEGELIILVFDSEENYLGNGGVAKLAVTNTGTMEFPLEDLTFGTYSILVYQDVNENGKFDKSFLGMPLEPYGFSNNVRPFFRAPTFNETRFEFKQGGQPLSIRIGKIWD